MWVSKYNRGISHVGIHPTLLPRSNIRCDVFHMACAIGKRLMPYLQGFALRQSRSFQSKLFSILESCWSPDELCLWRISKSFSQLLGTEIKAYVLKCPDISKLLNGKLSTTKEVKALSQALTIWYNTEKFLKIYEVKKEEVQAFPSRIDQFESNIKSFCKCGVNTFLTKVELGNEETYYLHALRYYIPRFCRQSWTNHRSGVGVFTIQGFERRNKESKTIMKKFSNNKQQKLAKILKKLWNSFEYERSKYIV